MSEIITGEEAEAVKSAPRVGRGRPTGGTAQALRDGAVVFTTATSISLSSRDARADGKRLRSRKGERNGVTGTYWWLENLEQ